MQRPRRHSCTRRKQRQGLQQPPDGEQAGAILPRGLRGSAALPAPRFWTSVLQNCDTTRFCCFKPPGEWYLGLAELTNKDTHHGSPWKNRAHPMALRTPLSPVLCPPLWAPRSDPSPWSRVCGCSPPSPSKNLVLALSAGS